MNMKPRAWPGTDTVVLSEKGERTNTRPEGSLAHRYFGFWWASTVALSITMISRSCLMARNKILPKQTPGFQILRPSSLTMPCRYPGVLQSFTPKDAGTIVHYADIFSRAVVAEAGAGRVMALLDAVGSAQAVDERREEFRTDCAR